MNNLIKIFIVGIVVLTISHLTFEQRTVNALKNRIARREDAFVKAVRTKLVQEGYMRSDEEMRSDKEMWE